MTAQRTRPGAAAATHLVVMGVSGSGKSTVAHAINDRLGWTFCEGDELHPQANRDKMAAGRPLTDSDRLPWLRALADWTAQRHTRAESTVLACSALRRSYRDVLRGGGDRTFFVHLVGDKGLLLERMQSREHFMPPSLLESQLDTLEPLQAGEDGMVVDVANPPARIAAMVLAQLDLA